MLNFKIRQSWIPNSNRICNVQPWALSLHSLSHFWKGPMAKWEHQKAMMKTLRGSDILVLWLAHLCLPLPSPRVPQSRLNSSSVSLSVLSSSTAAQGPVVTGSSFMDRPRQWPIFGVDIICDVSRADFLSVNLRGGHRSKCHRHVLRRFIPQSQPFFPTPNLHNVRRETLWPSLRRYDTWRWDYLWLSLVPHDILISKHKIRFSSPSSASQLFPRYLILILDLGHWSNFEARLVVWLLQALSYR